jgi:RND family efflux transporter MFP subunit
MKKLLFIILLIIVSLSVFFVLRSNKNKLDMKQKISESQIQKLPVRVDTVKKRILEENYSYTGILNPEKELMVVSQTQGEVIRVNVKIGDPVTRGKELIKVDDDILRTNLVVAEANFEKAKKDLERFEKMIVENGITQDQLEKMRLNLKNAEANYRTLTKRIEQTSIKAPFDGFINQLFTKEGSMLGPGTPVFEIVNIRKFKIILNVTEEEILGIDKGMIAEIIPKSLDSVVLLGKVSTKAMSANMAQQYAIELIVDNAYPEMLKGGMMAQVKLIPLNVKPVISIPIDVIRYQNDSSYVFTTNGQVAKKTWIRTGKKNNNYIEIKYGLRERELVIATGLDQLSDEQEIKVITGSVILTE